MKIASKKMLKYTGNAIVQMIPKNLDVYQKVEVKYPFYQVDVEDFGLFVRQAVKRDIENGK